MMSSMVMISTSMMMSSMVMISTSTMVMVPSMVMAPSMMMITAMLLSSLMLFINGISPEYKVMLPLMTLSFLPRINFPSPHWLSMTYTEWFGARLFLREHMNSCQMGPAITTCIHTPLDEVPVATAGVAKTQRYSSWSSIVICLEGKLMGPPIAVTRCLSEAELIFCAIGLSCLTPCYGYQRHDYPH